MPTYKPVGITAVIRRRGKFSSCLFRVDAQHSEEEARSQARDWLIREGGVSPSHPFFRLLADSYDETMRRQR